MTKVQAIRFAIITVIESQEDIDLKFETLEYLFEELKIAEWLAK